LTHERRRERGVATLGSARVLSRAMTAARAERQRVNELARAHRNSERINGESGRNTRVADLKLRARGVDSDDAWLLARDVVARAEVGSGSS